MNEFLRKQNNRFSDELIDFVQVLVKAQSLRCEERKVAGLIQGILEKLDYDLIFRDSAGNVLGLVVGPEEGATVLLHSHMDTAETPGKFPEQKEPVACRIEGGQLHGIGVVNSKSSMAAQIYAGYLLNTSLRPLHGTIVFAATVAGEDGCSVGTRQLLKNTLPDLGVRPDFAILGEPTRLALCAGHNGWVEVDIVIEGRNRLEVRQAAASVYIAHKFINNSAPLQEREDTVVSKPVYDDSGEMYKANFCVCSAVRPDEAPSDCIHLLRERTRQAFVSEDDLNIRVDVHTERQRLYTGMTSEVKYIVDPWKADLHDTILRRGRNALLNHGWREVQIRRWEYAHVRSGTAGSLLVNDNHIPTFGFGPGDERIGETPVETVAVDEVVGATFGTATLARSLVDSGLWGP